MTDSTCRECGGSGQDAHLAPCFQCGGSGEAVDLRNPFCKDCGAIPCQCPTIKAPIIKRADGQVTFEQDTWWLTADGLTIPIDNMTEIHRTNVARLLMRNAASFYAKYRIHQIWSSWWSYSEAAEDADWGPANLDEMPNRESITAEIQPELDRGEHWAWVAQTPLYKRMMLGIEPLPIPQPQAAPVDETADF